LKLLKSKAPTCEGLGGVEEFLLCLQGVLAGVHNLDEQEKAKGRNIKACES